MPRDLEREGAQAFDEVQAILGGGRRARFGDGEKKVMRFALDFGGRADFHINQQHFAARTACCPARQTYFRHYSPGVVSALLDWCELACVRDPCASAFHSSRVPRGGYLRSFRRVSDYHVWFFPGPCLQIMLRATADDLPPPTVAAPPSPLRSELRTIVLPDPTECPHCEESS
jgi:hypothetical protein